MISKVLGKKTEMPNVKIVARKVTLKRIFDRVLLETMYFLRITHSKILSLLNYAEGLAKAGIEIMNMGQQGICVVIH